MLKRRNRPLCCRVTGSAVLPKQSEVFIFRAVTTRAVKTRFERRNERVVFRQKRIVRLICNARFVGNQLDADAR